MKILFVCLGNICRSPMAEGIFRDKAKLLGLDIDFDSCGTGDWHVGDEPDERAQACIKKNGSDISDLRGRQFRQSDFNDFDRIYTMDESNHGNILKLTDSQSSKDKVKMILNETHPGSNMSVPDPYFGGDSGFDGVYQMLSEAADKVLSEI
ncbi:low molecular weight phosphotyrosine protein phosphatase [Salibacteraceae bacterium]|nr:low molecular weight phosphotyrosine protein phosphatase [Salibacteraceae bacterium]